jgi:hypothetical protein
MFSPEDLVVCTDYVADAWGQGLDRDWSVPAGTLEWSCTVTADHAFDATLAIGVFLASRRTDRYPDWGDPMTVGPDPRPDQLVEAIAVAGRLVAGVAATTPPDAEAILMRNPVVLAPPRDFPARAALEAILHGHDVAQGLDVAFDPPRDVCERLRDHTRDWRHWSGNVWPPLQFTDDPWVDIVTASGRRIHQGS